MNWNLVDLRYLSWTKTRQSSGTAGSYLKSYSYSNGKKIYYKLSYYDDIKGIFGYESINEIITCRLLELLNYDHLHYDLVYGLIKIKNKEFKTCLTYSLDFKEENESKITLENFYEYYKKENESVFDFCLRFGFKKEIYQMIIIDYLIMNRDRHGANIEVLNNSKTKKYRLAPLFDHGLSLISPNYLNEDILNFNIEEEKRVNSFIASSDLNSNIGLVPAEVIPNIKLDYDYIFNDLYDINPIYIDKCKKMIELRWNKLENIRDKK